MSTPVTDSSDQQLIGRMINGYRITRLVGRGGMGAVFAAELSSDSDSSGAAPQVAIKVLHQRLAAADPTALGRFVNEARTTVRIDHPGLVKVFDFGHLDDGWAYIMMEFLTGKLLRESLVRGAPMALTEACQIGRQIAAALGAAHEKGFIHRDLKPENIMLVPVAGKSVDQVKVLDFGLAKVITSTGMDTLPGYKTATGALLGTPVYMSPEQCRANGGNIDDRSDVYSFGVMLFEMLAGRPPFQSRSSGELIAMHILEDPPALGTLVPNTPEAVDRLLKRMLAKKPAERPAMQEVLQRLSALSTSPATTPWNRAELPTRRLGRKDARRAVIKRYVKTRGPVALGVLLLFGLATAMLIVMRRPGKPVPKAPPQASLIVPAADTNATADVPEPPPAPLAVEPTAAVAAPTNFEPVPAPKPTGGVGKRRGKASSSRPAGSGTTQELDVPTVF